MANRKESCRSLGAQPNAQSGKRVLAASAVLVALCASVISTAVVAEQKTKCQFITATVTQFHQVACAIPSPLPCFAGEISGDIKGSFSSQMTSPLTPTAQGLLFTAQTAAEDSNKGTIFTQDVGLVAFDFSSTTEVLAIDGGTGKYEGATGSVTLTGTYFTGGTGSLAGKICTLNK